MDNRKTFIIIAVVAAVLLIAGLALGMNNADDSQTSTAPQSSDTSMENMPTDTSTTPPPTTTTETPAATSSVAIKDYVYSPASVTVKKGTKVTWTNQDSVKHDVMSDSGKGPSSELLAQGESYSYTFDAVGTFTYHCGPHPYMKGAVIVTE